MSKQITVLGTGATALAAVAIFKEKGHTVTLSDVPERAERLALVRERGILVRGNEPRGLYRPDAVEDDIKTAVARADLVFVFTQAQRHVSVARTIAPAVREGQVITLVPGNLGSPLFHEEFQKAGVTADVILLEQQGNLFPVRLTAPAEIVHSGALRKKRAAAFPASRTREAIAKLEGVLELEPAKNVLETTINTPNVINHLTASVLNAAQIEKLGPAFGLFKDGLTPSVLDGLDLAYSEMQAVLTKAGYFLQSNPAAHLRQVADIEHNPQHKVFYSLLGPDSLHHRYITEDAPVGVSALVSLADKVGVPVPFTRSILTIISGVNKTDYYAEGRTLERFGLADASFDEVNAYFETGIYKKEEAKVNA